MSIAVVPVKPFSAAKHRLSPLCTPQERNMLAQAFLWDLLEKLCASRQFDSVCVISREETMGAWLTARSLPVQLLCDPGDCSLNDAFLLAVQQFSHQHRTMVFLHGDLPLVRETDFDCLLEPLRRAKVVLVPDRQGSGTNAVAVKLPTLFIPQFGVNSIRTHQTWCLEKSIPHALVYHERFGFDVDQPRDLQELYTCLSARGEPHTLQAMSALSLSQMAPR